MKNIFRKNKLPDIDDEQLVPASDGDSMIPFITWVKTFSSLEPKNVFEIGANLGQDAKVLQERFQLNEEDVWVFEPHPTLFGYIKRKYGFNAFDFAVGEKDGTITINAINPLRNSNTGISSVLKSKRFNKKDFIEVDVQAIRMDTFIETHNIETIDFLKLDVEGYNFEVLRGFGQHLDKVQSLHIEAEHIAGWEGQKLWEDIKGLLEKDYELVHFQRLFTQSDSFWIKRDYLRLDP